MDVDALGFTNMILPSGDPCGVVLVPTTADSTKREAKAPFKVELPCRQRQLLRSTLGMFDKIVIDKFVNLGLRIIGEEATPRAILDIKDHGEFLTTCGCA